MAPVIKGFSENIEGMERARANVLETLQELEGDRESVRQLFDELLVDANWSNHDSRKFKRHYKRGDEKFAADIKALSAVAQGALEAIVKEYQTMETNIDYLFDDPFWWETLYKGESS